MTDYISVGGKAVRPDYLLRHESLLPDLRRLVEAMRLPINPTLDGAVNASLGDADLVASLRANKSLKNAVESRYRDDMDYFGS